MSLLHFSAIEQKAVAPIYWAAERKCRRFTKQMISFVLFQQTSFVFALFFSFYCIYIGNLDTSTYYLPLRLAPPFNIDSLFKWYLFWVVHFFGGVAYLGGTVIVSVYFVCCCFYLEALCDHFDCLIGEVDAELCQNHHEPNARKLLSNTIDHHNEIYE